MLSTSSVCLQVFEIVSLSGTKISQKQIEIYNLSATSVRNLESSVSYNVELHWDSTEVQELCLIILCGKMYKLEK